MLHLTQEIQAYEINKNDILHDKEGNQLIVEAIHHPSKKSRDQKFQILVFDPSLEKHYFVKYSNYIKYVETIKPQLVEV